MTSLSSSPYIKYLKEINLFGNEISDEDVKALASSNNFQELQDLLLKGNNISEDASENLILNLKKNISI